MNYPGMRAEILDLFRDAQTFTLERTFSIWASRAASIRAQRQAAEKEEYHRHKALYRYAGAWSRTPPPRARVTTAPCALCGGTLETREGFAPGRFVHVGICSR